MKDGIDVLAALAEHGGYRAAARAIGMPDTTFRNRVHTIRRQSMTMERSEGAPLPGYIVTKDSVALDADGTVLRRFVQSKPDDGDVFEVPAGHVVKGESALVGPDGRILAKWVKTREGAGEGLIEGLQAAFAQYDGAAPVLPIPTACDDDLLTLYPVPDLHFGMYAWGKETGESYDIKIAIDTALSSIAELVAQSRPSKRAVILGLGDYFHANDEKGVTPQSGHRLDVDGRWPKVFMAGSKLAIQIVQMVAAKHEEVEIVFLPGNHDPDAAVCLTVALALFYSGNARIKVNISPGIAWYHRFGNVLLGATHGHTMKPERMGQMMAATRPVDWGATLFRHFYFGHIHHKTGQEVPGVMVESFESPAARDAFNAGAGYVSGRVMHAITFHKNEGEKGRHRVNIVPPAAMRMVA
jgi:hypothetical protein